MEGVLLRCSDAPFRFASVATIAIAVAACHHVPRPTPAPPFTVSGGSFPQQRIREYAQGLEFVQDPHISDEQPLIYPAEAGQSPRVGPTARIEPERGSRELKDEQLRAGRVIARIISDGPYEPLGIRRGIQYVWVDSTPSGWRAAMIPANDADPVTMLGLSLGELPNHPRVPAAAWRFVPGDGSVANGSCTKRCCVICRHRLPGCYGFPWSRLPAEEFGGRPGVPLSPRTP